MFRLLRGLLGLALMAAVVYGALYVPFGQRTLWEHIKAIASSSEGKKLAEGVKTKAGEVLDKARDKTSEKGKTAAPKVGVGTADGFTRNERAELRRLIRERLAKKAAKTKVEAKRRTTASNTPEVDPD